MNEEQRAFGYLCPACGKPVLGIRSPFNLTASETAVPCDCGESVLRTEYDGYRFRLSVPCGVCGAVHTAVCPPERVLRGDTALTCSKTGQFSCFIGSEGTVERNLGELVRLSERKKGQADGAAFLDEVVMYEVLSELKDIAARPDGIQCRCGSRRYGMEVRPAAVDLICRACGGRLRVPAASQEDLDRLCCQMKLTIPGREG